MMSPTETQRVASIALLPSVPRRLLTKAEAAAYLGICQNTFSAFCNVRSVSLADGRDRLVRYDVVDLDRWINQRKSASNADDDRTWDDLDAA
jgi:hypothetical protein